MTGCMASLSLAPARAGAISTAKPPRSLAAARAASAATAAPLCRRNLPRAAARVGRSGRVVCRAQGPFEKQQSANLKTDLVTKGDLEGAAESLTALAESHAWNYLGMALACVAMMGVHADAAHAQEYLNADPGALEPRELWSLAEGEDFWSNMGRYAKYAVTVVFGTGYVIIKPLFKYLSKPQTAIPLLLAVAGVVALVRITVITMLGINDPETVSYQ